MFNYVHLNIMIKNLQELCQIPLYKSAQISIRAIWQDLMKLANIKNSTKVGWFTSLNHYGTSKVK